MATQITDRLDHLYLAALDRDASLMHANAVSACSRWCTPKTTHAQVAEFTARQIASLEGLNDPLSCEIRESWEWLADALGTAPAVAPQPVRVFPFASRRDTATAGFGRGLRAAA
jgi:hypothetical protein